MRLSDVLSKGSMDTFSQIEGFLGPRKLRPGNHRNVEVGRVALNFYCSICRDNRTFMSGERLVCLISGPHEISIDALLECPLCQRKVEVWFLLECGNDLYGSAPEMRVVRRVENWRTDGQGGNHAGREWQGLLDRAQAAYADGLGAGAILYLRKLFEQITMQAARTSGIPLVKANGRRKPFRDLLREVDASHAIIPAKFSRDGYTLFSELSEVIHGDSEEGEAIKKYNPCRLLVMGVMRNVAMNDDIASAISSLGWDKGEVVELIAEGQSS